MNNNGSYRVLRPLQDDNDDVIPHLLRDQLFIMKKTDPGTEAGVTE